MQFGRMARYVLLFVFACLSAQERKSNQKGNATMSFRVTVKGFDEGGAVPKRFTCDGEDTSPGLEWSGEPGGTQSFALIVDDPDAPAGTWTHWLLWDIPAHVHALPEGFRPGTTGSSGKNDFGKPGYGGPCPPKGSPHRYYFTLYAVDRPALGVPRDARRGDLDKALNGRVIGKTQFMGRYGRQ